MSQFARIRRKLGPARLVRQLRRWRTRDRAWVGRIASLLGTVRLEGCRFRVSSALISDELKCRLLYGRYERTERELLRRHLQSALPVVELGGGIGVVACIVNARLKDRTRHVVVEANPRMLGLLADNRALNDAGFEIVHGAIAYGREAVGVRHAADLLATTTSLECDAEPVPAVSFRQIVEGRRFEACVLICDIEGAEVELVQHEIDTLQARAAVVVLEEHPERTPAEARRIMFERLTAAGFERIETLRNVVVLANSRPLRAVRSREKAFVRATS